MANKEDFTIDIGFNIVNDKETREQINKIMMERVVPIRAKFESIKSGTHASLQKQVIQTAAELRQLQSMTPTQAVNKILGATPRPGSAARDIRENIIHAIQTQDKVRQDYATLRDALQKMEVRAPSPIERLQDMAKTQLQESVEKERIDKAALADRETRDMNRLYAHLGAMEFRGPNPLERVQNKIRSNTFANTEKEIVNRQREFERQQAEEDHQTRILELIAKNTGAFKKWNEVDKWLVQHEQRRIRHSLRPGEPLTEYQEKVLGVGFFDSQKLISQIKNILPAIVAGVTAGYKEATREASLLKNISSMTGYSAQAERTLQYAGVSDAFNVLRDYSSFYDQLRYGDADTSRMEGMAMFGRRTFAYMRQPGTKDPRVLHAMFRADILETERKGLATRQYAAKRMGMEALLPTLSYTPEELEKFFEQSEGALWQQERAKDARDNKNWWRRQKDTINDYKSKYKTGAIAGAAAGGLLGTALLGAKMGAAAGTAAAPGIGTILGGLLGAAGLAAATAVAGAGIEDLFTNKEDALPSPTGGVNMSNTVNISMTEDAMRELVNGGSYIQTFDTTATIDNVA